MNQTQAEALALRLEELASSLEQAVQLSTTRIEHVRVAGHALVARRLAEEAALLARDSASAPTAA